MIRQYELENEQTVKGKFGITHLIWIHKYIFQDVYPFAVEWQKYQGIHTAVGF